MKTGWIKAIFFIAGVLDVLVGITFLFFANTIYDWMGVTRANHPGYIEFPALLIIIFGIMMIRIASDPIRFREFIWYGVGLKASYAGVVFYYMLSSGIPFMWVPFAIMDAVFLVLFITAWKMLGVKSEH